MLQQSVPPGRSESEPLCFHNLRGQAAPGNIVSGLEPRRAVMELLIKMVRSGL
jgi:hypothetical protein